MKYIQNIALILAIIIIGVSAMSFLKKEQSVPHSDVVSVQDEPVQKVSFMSKNLENIRNTQAVNPKDITQDPERPKVNTPQVVKQVAVAPVSTAGQKTTVLKEDSVRVDVPQVEVSAVPVNTSTIRKDFVKTSTECTYDTLADKNFFPQLSKNTDSEGYMVFTESKSGISIQGDDYSVSRNYPEYLQITLYSLGDDEPSGRVVLQKISDVCRSKMMSQVSSNQYARWISEINLQNYGDTEERLTRVERDAAQFAEVLYKTGILGFKYELTDDSYMNGTKNLNMYGDLSSVRTDKGGYIYAYYTFANSDYFGSAAFFIPDSFTSELKKDSDFYKNLIRLFTGAVVF